MRTANLNPEAVHPRGDVLGNDLRRGLRRIRFATSRVVEQRAHASRLYKLKEPFLDKISVQRNGPLGADGFQGARGGSELHEADAMFFPDLLGTQLTNLCNASA